MIISFFLHILNDEYYAEETNQKKSRILEKWIKNGLNDPNTIQKLNDDGIILPSSKLLD